MHTSPTYLSLYPQVTPAIPHQALPLRSGEEWPHGPSQCCDYWKCPHTFGIQHRACLRCDGALSTAEYSCMQTGNDCCSPPLHFKLGGPVLGDRSNRVNPCSTLTLRPMSPSRNHILMNVGMGSFPVLGNSCENSRLSKDGAFVLGLRLCCFLVD